MKKLCAFFAILLLALASVALAKDAPQAAQVLITDKDAAGTNVRDAPSGKVIATIPLTPKLKGEENLERRVVGVTARKGDWFSVIFDGDRQGWMHKSVLGVCASATEDGDPHLLAAPADSAADLGVIPDGTRLRIEGVKGTWLEVSGKNAKGKAVKGWLPEQSVTANPYGECWK